MRASRDELPELLGAAIRGADWGDLRSAVVSLPAGTDVAPLLKGLPDDSCPCPHWGYVVKGQLRVIYADREEVIRAGDEYHVLEEVGTVNGTYVNDVRIPTGVPVTLHNGDLLKIGLISMKAVFD